MSFEAAALAIKATTKNSTQKLVLIVISDCISGETGIGWPSIDYIALHAMCSPSSVRRAIRALVEQELLIVEEKPGRSNVYRIPTTLNASQHLLPIDDPSQIDTPTQNDTPPCHPIAGEVDKQKPEGLNQSLTNNIYIDQELWTEFLATRKKLKAVNSDRAIKALTNKIEKFHAEGIDVNQLIENSVVNSWKDIYPPRKENGNGNSQARKGTSPTALELATNMDW